MGEHTRRAGGACRVPSAIFPLSCTSVPGTPTISLSASKVVHTPSGLRGAPSGATVGRPAKGLRWQRSFVDSRSRGSSHWNGLPEKPLASYSAAMNYREIISIEPGKRGGKPCIRGMRISVYDILGWLAAGMTNEQTIKDFPELTLEDIRAALAYAADREPSHRLS